MSSFLATLTDDDWGNAMQVVILECDGDGELRDRVLPRLRAEVPFGYLHARKSAEPGCIEVPLRAANQAKAEEEVAAALARRYLDEPDHHRVSVRRSD